MIANINNKEFLFILYLFFIYKLKLIKILFDILSLMVYCNIFAILIAIIRLKYQQKKKNLVKVSLKI